MDKQKAMAAFNSVDGLIAHHEGALLYETAIKALSDAGSKNIVEIGSFLGRSTTVLAGAAEEVPDAKVYAIDPHEGEMMQPGDVVQKGPPTFERFLENISKVGLAHMVVPIRKKSCNVEWSTPIRFLFLDGFHDYRSVSSDYDHFRRHLEPGGYVAIHDYRDGFPGVDSFVDGMVEVGELRTEARAGSLVVFKTAARTPKFAVPLVVTSYVVPEARAAELNECLLLNVANPFVEAVHVLVENPSEEYDLALAGGPLACMRATMSHPKIRRVPFGRRVTYKDIFEYASSAFAGRAVMVSNADIWFDTTLGRLDGVDLEGRFLCMSRDDMAHMGANSQDTWMFKAPLRQFPCDWFLGPRGSENKVAYEAARARLEVFNPSLDVRTHHKHATNYRVGATLEQMPGPYLYVSPAPIEAIRKLRGA
jgi:predicted O-methyltransferase YrrM